jgi:hypothetical protein
MLYDHVYQRAITAAEFFAFNMAALDAERYLTNE